MMYAMVPTIIMPGGRGASSFPACKIDNASRITLPPVNKVAATSYREISPSGQGLIRVLLHTVCRCLTAKMNIDDIARYRSIPWVTKLLQDTSFVTVPSTGRETKASTEDSLFAVTLKSDTTLSGYLVQYRRPSVLPNSISTDSPGNIEEIRMFLILGDDMNGYPGVLHGGIVAAILDECLGLLLVLRNKYQAATDDNNAHEPSQKTVTAYLNTNFVRPVPTPGAIVIYANLEESKEQRKWKIKGRICDEADQTLATADCLYVRSRSKI